MKTAGVVALLSGTVGLSYGFAMTFLVPGTPREGFFQKERVLFGILPLVAAVLALCSAGWLFFHSVLNPKRHLSDVIALCIGGAIGAIWLFIVVGAIYQRAKGF
jgi:biotin transporter BioY